VYRRVGVGRVSDSNEVGQMNLVFYRNAIAGSNTGGIRETQDMIDFCAVAGIKPEIEKIAKRDIDAGWAKVFARKARYRLVIDMDA